VSLGAVHVGPGGAVDHRARALTDDHSLDPRRIGDVEIVAAESIGRETVQYVSNIYKYYLAYQMVVEQMEARAAAQETP